MYTFIEFPKWKYHPAKDPVIVQNADEEKALGEDWVDTPTAAEEAMHKMALTANVTPPPTQPDEAYKQPGYKREAK